MIARQHKRRYQRKLINKEEQKDTQDSTMINEKQRWKSRKQLVNLRDASLITQTHHLCVEELINLIAKICLLFAIE